MKIAIDLDEVVGDFMAGLIKFHNDTYNTNFTKLDFFSYKFWEVWGGSEEEAIQKVYDFHKTSYFNNIKPVSGVIDVLKELKKENELFLITSRQYDIMEKTKKWIEKYFSGIFSGIYFTNHYSQNGNSRKKSDLCDNLNIDVLIEDSLDYAIECLKPNRKIILFKYPWNEKKEKPKGIHTVSNWEEVLMLI